MMEEAKGAPQSTHATPPLGLTLEIPFLACGASTPTHNIPLRYVWTREGVVVIVVVAMIGYNNKRW
jgi:hypothetical protein